ncbi:NAD(P)-binding protein [Schizophyllum amplum]|uniref:NAD(P)-binding protein n=1 Tax=Schizophyllum amplum TaxID=97359 RepID=A0A550C3R6_9AGAR|nr:NAD(P)-binding protein [Auriculariopsis ampla]
MAAPTVYLISGANRGIGLGFVEVLVQRDGVIVFAGVRDPASAAALEKLRATHPDKLHIVRLVSADRVSAAAAVADIERVTGHLDVVIANAGIAQDYSLALEVSPEAMMRHYEVNVVGPLVLAQTCYPLMQESLSTPKFIVVSSGAGGITNGATYPMRVTAYGCSKAAVNYLARRLHSELPDLVCFPINPGGVATDLADDGNADQWIRDNVVMKPVGETVASMLSVIDNATRDGEGGQFVSYDGGRIPW